MKKTIILLITILLLLSMSACKKKGIGLTYTLNEDGIYAVSRGKCTDKNVVIPAEHNGRPVTRIENLAFSRRI